MNALTTLPVTDCWNSIGVKGNRSCERLMQVRHCHNCPVYAHAARTFLDRPGPAGYMEEMTALFAKSAVQEPTLSLSVVLFEIASQIFALETTLVVEVTESRVVHRVGQRSGRIFLGIVNIHGQLELCASMNGLLQVTGPSESTTKSAGTARMLLVEHQNQRWVFAADAVFGVQRFDPNELSQVPATALYDGSSYMKSIIAWGERRVGYLDADKMFAALARSVR